ncbi:MAG: 30S ribosomal protein S16 [Deltaproteobacteria bacterium RIFCSPLOWO2_01_44_7]|nr:MAG: 30S ribosomal protein S16 [Deltaproteobacteria bacterium RIFCSPHIGHO2_01_FULL_43_49]OGQ15562.1 MAG: 30S ribosomal protein S16 [Deltaproteobacteria bacterium RIFCSPHIGHO2_02_FULL_44_53]OGQ28504.1 MAG: 30S ribosomal protein S16 [Deltaproteobacteria bacterium RIFCSPHIGHO2_12_FULL_44_21]OGQ32368.1 MAG: 30S ribosomal protein S16 [Deltaproteobacteria bacterium RIFCSPLOWO2_01_FULL_45_74]OGQ40320.1 MAG: 30S ribosomal protein S16 [Deltaproteobacteria bacterium RIFCSPLOWO2_01_44_7]OGQ44010.1 MAG
MPVRIRLTRIGTNQKPFFRVVAASREKPRDGSFLEVLGVYNPKLKEKKFNVNKERIEFWLKKGAIPSRVVGQMLKKDLRIVTKCES